LLFNLLLLASLEKKFIYRKFDYLLVVEDNKLEGLEINNLVDKSAKD